MTEKSRQKLKYLENEKSFQEETKSIFIILALFRMDLFGATHEWGGGGWGKGPPSVKPVSHILQ